MFAKFGIGNLRIGKRLLLLISVQAAVLLLMGAAVFAGLDFANRTTADLSGRVTQQAKLSALSENLHSEMLGTVYDVYLGNTTWDKARVSFRQARTDFEEGWKDYVSGLNADDREFVHDVFGGLYKDVERAFTELDPILEKQDRPLLSLYLTNDLNDRVGPFLDALVASTTLDRLEANRALTASRHTSGTILYASAGGIGLGLLIAGFLGVLIYRSITRPVQRIAETVERVSEGDFSVRTGLEGRDELATLGRAFDEMLGDRVAGLQRAQEENERLNNSVIALLQAVSRLSQRDLTVHVPVTEDVTGPVADGLNLITSETARVLQDVRKVSEAVAKASDQVRLQSQKVLSVASEEQREVDETARVLADASEKMTLIAKLAHASNLAAEKAIASTQMAMETVTATVSGIDGIRDTIRETEKRIKRLGERSQEISGAVDLINTIAERTHILALNASMHAASAGEAGRGFAVVADEVQRLAQNARESTSQIATLVSNIQVETADTVSTMNEVISRVVSGSRLAGQAGQQMEETRANTARLVDMVKRIAAGSRDQARASIRLQQRAQGIRESTQHTGERLQEQSSYTDMLVRQSKSLLAAVSVFILPEPDASKLEVASPPQEGGSAPSDSEEEPPIAVNG